MMNILNFFAPLGFAETEIEDGLTALFYETDAAGGYLLVTDAEGIIPADLKRPVVAALYSPEGAFQWSVSFKNAQVFKDIWSAAAEPAGKLEALLKHRQNNETF
ncbi:MAG: hypothetical protein N2491_02250 [Negativicutes bacterium]|nr:hypothetical protein [Negativicutes bacterium]